MVHSQLCARSGRTNTVKLCGLVSVFVEVLKFMQGISYDKEKQPHAVARREMRRNPQRRLKIMQNEDNTVTNHPMDNLRSIGSPLSCMAAEDFEVLKKPFDLVLSPGFCDDEEFDATGFVLLPKIKMQGILAETERKTTDVPAAIKLHRPSLKQIPDLTHWQEISEQLLGDSYAEHYAKRRVGIYAFTTYRVGRELYHLAEEVRDWISSGSPTLKQGWKWEKNPIPTYLFVNSEDTGKANKNSSKEKGITNGE